MQELLFLLLSLCPATLAERDGFTLCYDAQHQRPFWTSHQPKSATAPSSRKHWRIDRELNSPPSSAFTNTGFDRGHLTPSADLPNSPDTFLTSNAVAQDPNLNRGPWRALENKIRKRHATRVITGAIYNNCGNEMIEAPCYLFKIAQLPDGQLLFAFAENAPSRQNPSQATSLNQINNIAK